MAYVARPAKPRALRSDDDEYYESVRLPTPTVEHTGAHFTGIYDARGVPIWREPDPAGFRFGDHDDVGAD